MRGRNPFLPWLAGAILVTGIWGRLPFLKAEPSPSVEGGRVTGILTANHATWIEVKADGEKQSVRYLPFWGEGGPNEETIKTIKKLIAPNRVKLVWKKQGNDRRIVSVEMLVPSAKSGTVTGTIVAKGENWIEVKPDKEGPIERYMPRWIGGLPKDGGGMDKDILRAIAQVKVGNKVKITWSYDERKRVLHIEPVQPR